MGTDWNLVLFIAFPVWIILNLFWQRRPRLIAYCSLPASFPGSGEGPPDELRSHSLLLVNVGRADAFQVRISHHTLPAFEFLYPKKFSVSPDFRYEVQPAATGGADIVIPVLASQQQITITYLYRPPLTLEQIHGEIGSKAGAAKQVGVLPVAEYPWWLGFLGVQLLEITVVIGVIYYFLKVARAIAA